MLWDAEKQRDMTPLPNMAVYRLLNTDYGKTEPALCFLRGYYPLSLQIFSLYLKCNTMKCVIQNIDKTPIEADFHH